MSADLMSLIHQAGFSGQAANTMYGIVMAESGGNARAFNGNANTGDQSYGLAQINMLGGMGPERRKQFGLSSNEDLYDPLTNLKVAYRLSNGGQDFTPWSTYKSGAYQQYAGQSGATVTSSGSGDSGGGGGAGTKEDPAIQFLNDASLGGLSQLLETIPQLKHVLDQAVAGGWTVDTFTNKIEDTQWFKAHGQAVRSALAEQANDPATWTRDLQNAENSVTMLSKHLGFKVDSDTLKTIATTAILTGNQTNQDWLTQALGRHQDFSGVKSGSDLNGQMATAYQQLSQWSADYGIPMSTQTLSQYAQQIAEGNNSADHYQEQFKTLAMGKYPGLVSQIQAGQTVRQIADPYIQQYANLLELDPNGIDFNKNTMIQSALQGVPTGQGSQKSLMSMTDFEKQVRQDPRWGYTQNAKDTFSSALVKVGHDWGFGF